MSSRVIDVYFDDGGEGSLQCTLKPGHDTTTNAYEGHVFFYTTQGDKNNVIGKFTIVKEQVLYSA